jgi:hypothetical protein
MKINLTNILLNWKTSIGALGLIIVALGNALPLLLDGNPNTSPDWNLLIPELMAAFALLFAADGDK